MTANRNVTEEGSLQPIFQPIFGESWQHLPVVFKTHYANRAYSDDLATVEGTLNVSCGPVFRLLRPLFHFLGSIPPYDGHDVPVTVNFRSTPASKEFHFDRVFHFPGRKPWQFRSKMLQVDHNEVIEIMRFGFAWRLYYEWDNDKVVLRHKGYGIRILGTLIPLPLSAILGRGYAQETAIDDDSFAMHVNISHPWWGRIYEYEGRFRVTVEV